VTGLFLFQEARSRATKATFKLGMSFEDQSTSIHLIQIGVTRLMQLSPFGGITNALINRYNDQSRIEYERVRDFIILHCKVTERRHAVLARLPAHGHPTRWSSASSSSRKAGRGTRRRRDAPHRVVHAGAAGTAAPAAWLPSPAAHARAGKTAQGARHSPGQQRQRRLAHARASRVPEIVLLDPR
jgi:tryptophan halogenase